MTTKVSPEKIVQLARNQPDVRRLLKDFPRAEILAQAMSSTHTSLLKEEYPEVFKGLSAEGFCVNVISPEMDGRDGRGYQKIRLYFLEKGRILKKILA